MAPHRHFLLVDQDDALRAWLAGRLAAGMDCTVTSADSVAEATVCLAGPTRFDAILLDTSPPDGDGVEFCRGLRRRGINAPVLMLGLSDREEEVVRGLDAGANDYVVKPLRCGELIARMQAQLRAFETSEHAEIGIGPYVFRPATKTLHEPAGGRPIRLTEKEAAVLKYLYRAQGAPVRREALLHDVWGYSAQATTHTVETHIYRLRRKIEPSPHSERLLVNDGRGYRLLSGRPRPWRTRRIEGLPAGVFALAG